MNHSSDRLMAGERVATDALLRACCQFSARICRPPGTEIGLSFRAPGRVIDFGTTGPRPSRSHDDDPPASPARTEGGPTLVGRAGGDGAGPAGDRLPDPHRRRRGRPRTAHARGVRHLGPGPPDRRRGGGPDRRAARRHRAAPHGDRDRLDRSAGRRHRLPGRALRWQLARRPGRVRRRARGGAARRGRGDAAVRRRRHRDGPPRHDHARDPGSRRGAGPRRVAGLHRPRQPREHRLTAGHRRARPRLPGADRGHHPHRRRRGGDEHRRRGVRWHDRRHRATRGPAHRRRGPRLGGRRPGCDVGRHGGGPLLRRRTHR